MTSTWTISELAERAAAALAADGSPQVSGRVRDVPNERLIRWYTTIGLVDPPLGRRGRTALYGPRHLLQLVAVKRRQAAGRSIAEIQTELAGATDATLERIAALPSPATAPPLSTAPGRTSGARGVPHRPRHAGREGPPARTGRPSAPVTPAPAPATAGGAEPAAHPTSLDEADTTPSEHGNAPPPTTSAAPTAEAGQTVPPPAPTASPADATPQQNAPADETPDEASATGTDRAITAATPSGTAATHDDRDASPTAFWRARPDVSYTETAVVDDYGSSDASPPTVVQGVRLTPGLTLLLDVPALDGEDLAAIESAARPLLDELRRRGLLTPDPSPAYLPADSSRRSQ